MTTIVNPTPGRVLVQLVPESDKTSAGLFLPDQNEKVSVRRGAVVACGWGMDASGIAWDTKPFEVGQIILVNRSSGLDMKIDGVEHRMLHHQDVIATVTTKATKA